jgi:hypothetical protein
MYNRLYPYHNDLRGDLRTIDAPWLGVRLMRAIMDEFEVTQTEAEVLMVVASYRNTVSFENISDKLPHLSKDSLKRALLSLGEGHIYSQAVIDHEHFIYSASAATKKTLKTFTLDSLSPSPASYVAPLDPPAPVEVVTPPVEEKEDIAGVLDYNDRVFGLLEALKVHFPSIAGGFARGTGGVDWDYILEEIRGPKPVNTDPTGPLIITPELDTALGFAYGLVAPGADANASILANPRAAALAHRAIYERRPREESYNDMIHRLYPQGVPAPGPTPAPRHGFFKTVFDAAFTWLNGK